jgi:hypothetical protein
VGDDLRRVVEIERAAAVAGNGGGSVDRPARLV